MKPTHTHNAERQAVSDKLASDTTRFTANGGQVKVCRPRKRKHENRTLLQVEPFKAPRPTAGQVVVHTQPVKRVRPRRARAFVGVVPMTGNVYVFFSNKTRSELSDDYILARIHGPFKTNKAAHYMASAYLVCKYMTVTQIEKIAKEYAVYVQG